LWINQRGNHYIEVTQQIAQYNLDNHHSQEDRAFVEMAHVFQKESVVKKELEAIKNRYIRSKESENKLKQVEQAVRDVRKRIYERPITAKLSAREKDWALYVTNELESAAYARSVHLRNLREAKRRAEQGGFRTMVELWSGDFSKRWNNLFGSPS
jgi:hypothetical protein